MKILLKNILYYILFFQISSLFVNAQRYCNGYESYCYTNYNDLTYPTTHNSFSVGKSYSANQELGILRQLHDGIRALMLDVYFYDDGSIHCCHTSCYEPYLDGGRTVDILFTIANFINQNPNEVITIFIENFNGNVPPEIMNEVFINSGLINYVYTPPYPGAPWPTLGEMIDNQQNVVVFTDKLYNPALYPWYLPLENYVTYNYFVSSENEYWNCDIYNGNGGLFLLYHMKHVKLGNAGYLPDTTIIDKTNSIKGINEHTRLCPYKLNFIAVDYYNHGNIVEFATKLNGQKYYGARGFLSSDNHSIEFRKRFILIISFLITYLLF